VIIEWRWAEGKFERLPELAADLVRVGVDVIVTGGPQATRPARDATSTVPIVMGFDNDPVGAGFIVSLARPGRNITGLSSQAPEITGKQLELLREIVPRLSRVAVLGNSAEPGNAAALGQIELAARALGIQLQHLDLRDSKDIDAAFRAATRGRAEALMTFSTSRRKTVCRRCTRTPNSSPTD